MITLITGTPGSGKTLYSVSMLIKEIKKNPERPIFADIDGLKIEGVNQPPDDWRDAPEGSLIIYDEVQYRDAYRRGRGATKYQYIRDLTTHRHGGYDLWLITQSSKFLHVDVLEVVGTHYHVDRPYGASLANISRWRDAQKNPKSRDARQAVEEKQLFKYDKTLFDYYKSVDVDDDKANHKGLKIPLGKIAPFIIGFALIFYVVFSFAGSGFFGEKEKKAEQPKELPANIKQPEQVKVVNPLALEQPQQAEPQVQQATEQQTQQPQQTVFNPLTGDYIDANLAPTGVMQFGDKCRVYNKDSSPLLHIDAKTCQLYVSDPSLLVKVVQ